MKTLPKDTIYSDMGRSIGVSLIDTVLDHDSLVQKILYVIGTRKGSRKWRPKFGSDVAKYLFEPFDETTAGWIQTYSRLALEDPANGLVNDITDIQVIVQMAQEQTYLCTIAYRAPKLEARQQIRFAVRGQG